MLDRQEVSEVHRHILVSVEEELLEQAPCTIFCATRWFLACFA